MEHRTNDRFTFPVRAATICAMLVAANIVSWGAALRVSASYPLLWSSAMLAYGLGLRHAFDADHIAAIDNVTRRLVASGERPAGVGFFFSLGHSSVVVAASIGVALAASQYRPTIRHLHDVLEPFGALFSSIFLLSVAALNLMVFLQVWRALRRERRRSSDESATSSASVLPGRLNGLVRGVGRSATMFPLGLVFGLGFDTATEIGLLGLAATEAAKGLPIWSILVFPALFASGMALADTLESLFMLGAYRWTATRPRARLHYNLAATGASILAGVVTALGQLASFMPRLVTYAPVAADASAFLDSRSEWVGLGIVTLFAVLWAAWAFADRARAKS